MLTIKSEGIKEIADSLDMAIRDASKHVEETFDHMGPIIVNMMRRQLAPHRYSGDLEQSIEYSINMSRHELRIGSNLQRGGMYNALHLLERGARPANVPFTPIAKWAAFRGLPAGPIWMSIRQKGVMPHPFMENTSKRPEFVRSLNSGAKKLATDLLVKALTYRRGMKV